MRQFVVDSWDSVMNMDRNPLKNIPDIQTRHLIMQILAWMWCIAFGFIVSSMWMGIISMMAHIVLLGAIAITVATFETAKRRPTMFNSFQSRNGRANGGEHE